MAEHLSIGTLFDVRGRLVAITGAASGIGRMLARGCAANGASTILIDINEKHLAETKSDLEKIVSSLGSPPSDVTTYAGDLSTQSGVQAIVAKVKSTCTSLDAIIHCAGVRYMNEITYTSGANLAKLEAATSSASYSNWEKTFRVNVLAPYFLTAGLTSLLGAASSRGDGRGCVILLSSPASVHNHQFVPSYQTSKAAVDHLTRILAMEFSNFYIRVNAISPGIVPSAMTPADGSSNLRLAEEAPAGRAGGEEDMVGTALWLMSKAGSFMDGKVIRCEGGRLLILRGGASL